MNQITFKRSFPIQTILWLYEIFCCARRGILTRKKVITGLINETKRSGCKENYLQRDTLNNLSEQGRHWYILKLLWWVMCNSRKLSSEQKVPSGSVFLSCRTMKFLNVNYASSNSDYPLINNINYRLNWLDVACDWIKPEEQRNLFL